MKSNLKEVKSSFNVSMELSKFFCSVAKSNDNLKNKFMEKIAKDEF